MAVCAYGQGTKVTINGGSYTQNITGTGDQFDMIYASDKAVSYTHLTLPTILRV